MPFFAASQYIRIKVNVLGPSCDTLFMVRVRIRVISGYDVTLNISTPVTFWRDVNYGHIRQISPTMLIRMCTGT